MNHGKRRVGIVGASGVVGREVALLLREMFADEIVLILRTTDKTAFFQAMGFCCRVGSLQNKRDAKRLLNDLDVLVDFSLPKGSLFGIVKNIWLNVRNMARFLKPGVPYLYASSILAFGMPRNEPGFLKYYLLPRSKYGFVKRSAEWLVRICCLLNNRRSYILRLAQVHGVLQRKIALIDELVNLPLTEVPLQKSATIFTPEIAQYIHHLTWHEESARMFTLVSNPEWNWHEVLTFYQKIADKCLSSQLNHQKQSKPFWHTTRLEVVPGERLLFTDLNKDKIYTLFVDLIENLRAVANPEFI